MGDSQQSEATSMPDEENPQSERIQWSLSADGVVVSCNSSAARVLGFAVDDQVGEAFLSRLDPRDRDGVAPLLAGRPVRRRSSRVSRFRTAGGSSVWLQWSMDPRGDGCQVSAEWAPQVQPNDPPSYHRLSEAIQDIQLDVIASATPYSVFDKILATMLQITGSEYGFVAEALKDADGNPYVRSRAISNIAWSDEMRQYYEDKGPEGLEFRNLKSLFGEVLVTGEAVIANDPARDPRRGGMPAGHPDMRAFLGVPLYQADRLLGMVGLANREGGYSPEIVQYLQPLLTTCSAILRSYQLELDRQNLARRETELFGILEQSLHELYIIDGETFQYRWVNRGGRDNLGYSMASLQELTPADVLHGLTRHSFETIARRLLDGTIETSTFESEHRRRDGTTYPVEVCLSLTDLAQPRCLVAFVLDRTERIEAEAERAQLEQQVRQAQKLESLGILAGGIAHDFNNLLVGVLGNAGDALLEVSRDSPVRESLEQIERSAIRASDLTRQMLAYAGKGSLEMQPLNLSTVVSEMGELLAASIGKNVDLRFALPDEPASVRGDPSQLRQIVLNLITNASDAIGDDPGTIEVKTGVVALRQRDLSELFFGDGLRPSTFAYVEVRDSGCGMDSQTMARMFDPFFTTKETGHGLGMAAVLGIVRGHAGGLDLESEPGQGTRIRVVFPIVQQAEDTLDVPPERREVEGGHGVILVVDDEDVVRRVHQRVLERSGYEVWLASDGVEALRQQRQNPGRIRAVILDMTMPRMSGVECLRALRETDPGLPIVLSSGYETGEAVVLLEEKDQPSGFLQKPFRPRDLLGVLQEVLQTAPRPSSRPSEEKSGEEPEATL